MRSSTAWTSGTTFTPSTMMTASRGARRATCSTARSLGGVDLLAAEHRVDPLRQAGSLGQLQQEAQRFVGDAVLGVVEVEADGFGGQALAPLGIVGEEGAEGHVFHRGVVLGERLPCGQPGKIGYRIGSVSGTRHETTSSGETISTARRRPSFQPII